MNEKEIYAVYVGTMKIHKKYAAHAGDMAHLPALIGLSPSLSAPMSSGRTAGKVSKRSCRHIKSSWRRMRRAGRTISSRAKPNSATTRMGTKSFHLRDVACITHNMKKF